MISILVGYSDVQLKIVRGMVRTDAINVKHHGERGRGRICVESGRFDGQQQTVNKYADHTSGREHRPRRGYRWYRGEAFGEGEFAFLKLRARALRNNATEWREHREKGDNARVTHVERVYGSETNRTSIVTSPRKQVSPTDNLKHFRFVFGLVVTNTILFRQFCEICRRLTLMLPIRSWISVYYFQVNYWILILRFFQFLSHT